MSAILHFDGDSFFASVEQVMDYRLRDKPVVTGAERGAPTSVSVEAKRRGLYRGMSMGEIKIRCPEVVIVASNYTAYGIFAHRMYDIVRTYTPDVEEYSIDECFADVTFVGSTWHEYEQVAMAIKAELEDSLGLTFGVGLASSKTLAKAASKAHKPAGFTSVPEAQRERFLASVPIHYVWGLGGATGLHLEKLGIETALDFARQTDDWLSMHRLGKSYRDVWLELNGQFVKKLNEGERAVMGSLMHTRTFKPPSLDRNFIFAQVSNNLEAVCEKARRHSVRAGGLSFYLKTQSFTYHAVSFELAHPTADPSELLQLIASRFEEVYATDVLYRATGVTLRSLIPDASTTPDLFGRAHAARGIEHVLATVDTVNQKYGRHTLFLGSSMPALPKASMKPFSSTQLRHKTLKLPMVGVVS